MLFVCFVVPIGVPDIGRFLTTLEVHESLEYLAGRLDRRFKKAGEPISLDAQASPVAHLVKQPREV